MGLLTFLLSFICLWKCIHYILFYLNFICHMKFKYILGTMPQRNASAICNDKIVVFESCDLYFPRYDSLGLAYHINISLAIISVYISRCDALLFYTWYWEESMFKSFVRPQNLGDWSKYYHLSWLFWHILVHWLRFYGMCCILSLNAEFCILPSRCQINLSHFV